MEETSIQITDSFMDFAYKCHNVMRAQNLSLVYEGEINQSIVKTFTALAEKNLNKSEESTKTKKTVYHVMVECLQNIVKHGDEENQKEVELEDRATSGIIIVGDDEGSYSITTGNSIPKNKIESMSQSLDHLNNLNRDELKELYKDKMRNNEISEKGGAGLGFVDMARKSGKSLGFDFEKMDDTHSFFALRTTIPRV